MRLDLKLSADSVCIPSTFSGERAYISIVLSYRTELFKLTMHVAAALLSVHTSCY